jgi:hypothetical protein
MADIPNQLKFEWDLPEEEISSALSADEIQLRKDLAEAFIRNPGHWEKDAEGKPVPPYWLNQAITLHEGKMKFPFRAAVLAAWLCTPKKYRYPETQDQLAGLLGLSSDRQFTVWMAKNPQIKAVVHSAWKENALDRLNDSMEAMYTVAALADYKGKGDRELHFKVAGILNDTVIVDKSGNVDLSKLSFDEKLRLAGLDNPDALIALRAELAKRRTEMEALSAAADAEDEEENAEPNSDH